MKRIARVALALVMLVGLLGTGGGSVQAQPPPWQVRLDITSNIGGSDAIFGVAESATGGFDAAFDDPAPADPYGDGILGYFWYPSDPTTELRKLRTSYIAPADVLTWTLRVLYKKDGPTTGDVTITWNPTDIANVPSVFTSILLRNSGDTTTLADMRVQSSYTFPVTVPDGLPSAITTFVVKVLRPPDTTAPTVLATSPPANATNVPVNTTILVTFSESMNATLAQSAFSISPTVSGAFSWAGSGTNMTFTPSANLSSGTLYTATIGTGAKDLAGNPLAQAKVWSFTTMKEVVSITVTPVNPVIKPNQTLQFTATGIYSDNTSANLTASVSWGSSNTTVASINATTGLAQGLVEGITYIYAILSQTAGDRSDSTIFTVDDTNPVVTVSYPNGGEILKGGATVTITWSATDANMAASPITIEFYHGTPWGWGQIATNEVNDGTYNWIVPSLNISTARVRVTAVDKAGNTGSDESNANFTIDSTPPTIISVSPASGATNVALNATIQFTFSEPMVWTSVQNAFSISPTVQGSLTYFGTTKTFTPSANLTYNTLYTVTVNTTATDLAGNPLEAKVWSFTTVKQPPAVTTSNATGITISSATLNGILTSLGSYTPVNVSFVWGTTSGNLTQTTTPQAMTTIGPFSANLTGLILGTTYYFRAKAVANGVTVYGDILSVTTVRLVSIDMSPDNPRIALGRSQQFTATGTYDDNSTGDVTNIVSWTSSNPTVAVIGLNTGLATTMGKVEGVTLITAAFGDATPDSTNLTVGPKELETIVITPTSASIPVGKTKAFTAMGTYSDLSTANLTDNVTWLSANPTIAAIRSLGEANPGRATGMKLGETTIVAIQGSIKSNVAKVTVTSAVLDSIQITPSYASIPKGKTKQFIAVAFYSDSSNSTITSANWTSSNTTVANISSTGLAKSYAQGTTTITANLGGVTSNTAILDVGGPVLEGIKVTPQNPTIALGTITTLPFTATAIYTDGSTTDNTSDAIWSSSDNTTVATISSTGLATIIGQGKTTITATLGDLTGSSVLIVAKPALVSVQIDDVYPASDNVIPPVAVGNTTQLYLTGIYSDNTTANLTGTAIWSSSNTTVATISASGLVGGKTFGTANITAIHTGLRSTVKIAVTQAPAVAARAANPVGDTTATLNGFLVSLGSASNVTVSFEWGLTTAYGNQTASQTKTSTGAFSVSLSGLLSNTTYHFRAKAAGDGTSYSGDLIFTTSALPPTVTTSTATGITSSSATINGTLSDLKGALAADVSFEWGLTTAYDNETTPVSMDSTGNFSATLSNLAPSTTYHFRAKAVGFGTSYGADNTFRTSRALVSIEITPANPSVPKGKTVQFTAWGINSEGPADNITATANWASSPEGVATIDSAGLATGRGIGTANITATDPVTGKFSTTTLRVLPPVLESITVTGPAQIAAGVTTQFTAMGKFSDNSSDNITTSVIWITDNTSLASVDSATGLVTGRNVGSANITATKGKVSGRAVLMVTRATLISIDVTPSAPVITLGNPQQFKAVGVYSDGRMADITRQATWTSSTPSVADNPVNGLVTTIGKVEGTANITATDPATGKFDIATLIVKEATLTAITISANVTAIPAGRVEQFTAIGTYSDGSNATITKDVNWVSSDITTARINAAGVANSFAPGTTNITASLGGIPSNAITLTIGNPVLDAIQIRPVNPSVTLVSGSNQTLQFNATGIYSGGSTTDNTTDATWSSSDNTTVASISPTGLVTIIGQGKTTITAVLLTASRSTELTVLPDKTSPAVTLTSPTDGLLLSEKSLVVSGRVDDTSANTTVIVNGVSFPVTLEPRTGNFSQDLPLKSGSNSIQVKAIDGVGNTGASGTLTVVVDVAKVKPVITITKPSPVERLTRVKSLIVEGTITGNVTSATLIFNGLSTGVSVVGGGFSANVTLLDGVNIIVVNAYTTGHLGDADYLGTSGVIAVTLDRDVPRVIINSPVSGTITSVRLSEVSGTIDDPWVTSVVITANDKPESIPVVKGVFSQTVTLQPELNTITVEATDEAGNTSSVTTTLTLDNSVPGVTITAPTNKLLTNTVAQIVTGNVTDLSITTANLTLNGAEQEIPVAPDGSFSQAITLAPGLNTIKVTASDSAVPANTGTSGEVTVTLKNIAPVIIAGLSNPTESILITVTSNETLEGLPTVRITGLTSESVNMTLAGVNKWTGSYGSEAEPIAAGEYRVTVTGTDKAGNTTTVTATFAKKTIDVSGIEPTTVTTPTTTLEVETNGAVNDVDISVTQHIDNPSGNVGNPEGAAAEVGVFVEIVAPPELNDNLKQIYIRVDYDPDELPEGTDESSLKLYLWDVTLGIWQVVPDSGVNTEEDYIYGTVSHLSKYGGFGKPKAPPPAVAEVLPAGPAVDITSTVSLSGFSATPSLKVDSSGVIQETAQPKTLDGKASLGIAKGTKLLDSRGNALTSISASVVTSPPAPPAERVIIFAYDFGPVGATFAPAITLTISYDPAALPKGVAENELYLAYWNGSQWVALASTVNSEANTVSAAISHFTQFAVTAKLPAPLPVTPPPAAPPPASPPATPAAFTTSALTISPTEVSIRENVAISVLVTNTGELTGSYGVVLKIDNVAVATKDVTLAGGASQTVTFTTTQDASGTYTVTIDGLSGEFTVKKVEVVIPTPTKPTNWGLIGGIIAGLVVVGLLVYFFVWRRRGTLKPS